MLFYVKVTHREIVLNLLYLAIVYNHFKLFQLYKNIYMYVYLPSSKRPLTPNIIYSPKQISIVK